MPSLITPQRRRRDSDSDDNDLYDGTPAPTTERRRSGKGARLNKETQSQNSLQPAAQFSQQNGVNGIIPSRSRASETEVYQPGSIVRIKMVNFVTYSAAEFYPGPTLNMIIGPNGTGKSTLVCAICIGLGWDTKHLGRAKEVAEFVKHGTQEATIEIELFGPPKVARNPVIKCQIKRQENKCSFMINNKAVSRKQAVTFARGFSIQLDNLCQFLPQDRVVEFAAMDPVRLLHSTLQAVAPPAIIKQHQNLIELRGNQRLLETENATDIDNLKNLETRQKGQEHDVQRMREREEMKKKLDYLTAIRPIPKYRAAVAKSKALVPEVKKAKDELLALEREVQPLLSSRREKERYNDQVAAAHRDQKSLVDEVKQRADGFPRRIETLEDEAKGAKNEADAERKGNAQNKAEIKRLSGIISRLKNQMEQSPVDEDLSAYNEQIRDKMRRIRELFEENRELEASQRAILAEGKQKNIQITRAKRELEDLESQAGQQSHKLRQMSQDSWKAWDWIQNNQNQFEKRVYGPPMIECSIKDARYINLVEAVFQQTDFIVFTVQTRQDFDRLSTQLYRTLKLSSVNIRTMTGSLDEFRTPLDDNQARRFGIEGWALDYVDGPDAVLAMLCAEGPRLHQTGVSLQDTTQEQYDALQNSNMSTWVTSKSLYKINRRREYGPGATSTTVRDVKPARVWTSQPVDNRAKADLQGNVEGWTEELNAIKGRADDNKVKNSKIGKEIEQVKEEQAQLERDKEAKKRAIKDFKALPARITDNEVKLQAIEEMVSSVRERYEAHVRKEEGCHFQKAEVVLEYAKAVTEYQSAHETLQTTTLMLIEATSELETLIVQNSDIEAQVQAARTKEDTLKKEHAVAKSEAVRLNQIAVKLIARAKDNEPELHDFMVEYTAKSKEMVEKEGREPTSEDLEDDIAAEAQKLDLLNDGGLNDNLIREFEARAKKIDGLQKKLENVSAAIEELADKVREVREAWETEVDGLVDRISQGFGFNMGEIGCAGEVGVYKDEESFELWAIHIRVKFRENESLTLLDSKRQSGGERAVSTVFYLMALQSLQRSPFRVVDEINQGMDQRNERLVHKRMVQIATGNDKMRYAARAPTRNGLPATQTSNGNRGVGGDGEDPDDDDDDDGVENGGRSTALAVRRGTNGANGRNANDEPGANGEAPGAGSQYFLLTPKLLHGLHYERGMRVMCIASGEYITEGERIDFEACIRKKRELNAGKGGRGKTVGVRA